MKLIKSFAKFSIGVWIQAVLSLISTPIMAWYITPDDFGKASMFILAYKLVFNVILLGADQGFARYYNEDPSPVKLLRAALLPVIVMGGLVIAILELFRGQFSTLLFGNIDHSGLIHLLSVTIITGVLLQLGVAMIRMQSNALKYSVIQISQAILNFVFVIGYAKYVTRDFSAVIFGLVFSQVIGLIITIFYNYKIWFSALGGVLIIDKKKIRTILIYSLPFVPTFLLDWVFQGADRTFLRIYSDFTQIGLYATAAKIAFSLNIIQSGFTAFWLPFSLEKYNNHPEDTKIYSTIFNVLVLVFGGLILGLILFQKVILLLLPATYDGILTVFPILLFIPMLYTLSEVTVVGVNYKAKTVQHLYVIIFSVIANIIIAYLLTPVWGAKGAAMAMFVGYIVFFCCRTFFGIKNYYIHFDIKRFIFAFILILIPVILTVFTNNNNLYLLSIISIAVLLRMYITDLKSIRTI
ncbi:O-antigen/teichoic acid export membrane protein [Pedobacter cryoconitis]|uniref:O-antigen/teichoic acid export membrane protein n=1 Tax=Pedobacter cryoconitis TaxID=188932 RepID=A0A7W9E0G2_9SPHI|nr:lipopolysaccharide biosynthesis protein [Pedobacter cryoconitis]MBB5636595.1 O-antigen/teichoic acid export membrane protein [Pedobacter cryoconitis]